MTPSSATLRIFKLLGSQRRILILLVFLVLLATGFDIGVAFVSQKLIDALVGYFTSGGAAPVNLLILTSLAILAATVIARIAKSIYDYKLFTTITRFEDQIRHWAFEKYLRLHALFHHGSSSGQIIGRIDRGTSGIFVIVHDILGQNFLPPLVTFLGVLAALTIKNPWISLAVFLPLPIYVVAIKGLTDRIYHIEKRANEEFEAVAKESYDVAANVLTVKKFSQEQAEVENQKRLQKKARKTEYEAERLWEVIANTQTAIATAGRIAVILIGGFLVINGRSTVGEFVLYVTLQNMAYSPLAQLSHTFPRLRRNISRAERLFQILDEPIRVTDKPEAASLPPLKKKIELRNVSFRYSEKRRWALRGVNLAIPAGKTVALVGRSGSGKTTFINLLLRSYDPTEGTISFDGHDLRDATQESLREQIAVVPQEVDLFSRTIAENIAYGRPDVSRKAISKAAKIALAHDFIARTEQGYDTLVGERGIKLSGGERQRVGIARAILRDPTILILDEATSHLDTESERLIQKATNVLIKNRTSFIIAHRLSTVLHADVILVFKGGGIEAAGKHAELLKKSPTYRKLYSLQFNEP